MLKQPEAYEHTHVHKRNDTRRDETRRSDGIYLDLIEILLLIRIRAVNQNGSKVAAVQFVVWKWRRSEGSFRCWLKSLGCLKSRRIKNKNHVFASVARRMRDIFRENSRRTRELSPHKLASEKGARSKQQAASSALASLAQLSDAFSGQTGGAHVAFTHRSNASSSLLFSTTSSTFPLFTN